jgi:hypothetical protein
MRVIMFQERFAGKVRDGDKLQTIRKTARCKPGDTLSLRRWTGKPYRSKQEVLREASCRAVTPVRIGLEVIRVGGDDRSVKYLPPSEAHAFAIRDGFRNWAEMRDWFDSVHGLPFVGWLIEWSTTAPKQHEEATR